MRKTLVLVGPALCPPKYNMLREVEIHNKLAYLCDNITQNPVLVCSGNLWEGLCFPRKHSWIPPMCELTPPLSSLQGQQLPFTPGSPDLLHTAVCRKASRCSYMDELGKASPSQWNMQPALVCEDDGTLNQKIWNCQVHHSKRRWMRLIRNDGKQF